MFHIVPMCCVCLKKNMRLEGLEKLNEADFVLLKTLTLLPFEFELLKLNVPLHICKKCSYFLLKLRAFQSSFANNTTKLKGYVVQLKMGNNFEPTNFCELSVSINRNCNVRKMNNELIEANQPMVELERMHVDEAYVNTIENDAVSTFVDANSFDDGTVEIDQFLVCELTESKQELKAIENFNTNNQKENSSISSKELIENMQDRLLHKLCNKKTNKNQAKKQNKVRKVRRGRKRKIKKLNKRCIRTSSTNDNQIINQDKNQLIAQPVESICDENLVTPLPPQTYQKTNNIYGRNSLPPPPSQTLISNIRNKFASILDSLKASSSSPSNSPPLQNYSSPSPSYSPPPQSYSPPHQNCNPSSQNYSPPPQNNSPPPPNSSSPPKRTKLQSKKSRLAKKTRSPKKCRPPFRKSKPPTQNSSTSSPKYSLPPPSERLKRLFDERLEEGPILTKNIKQEDFETEDSQIDENPCNIDVVKTELITDIKTENVFL